MAALSKNLTKINISLEYDAITIYPTTQSILSPDSESSDIILFIKACDKAGLIEENNKKFFNCVDNIYKAQEFDRTVHRLDPDHNLYHQDEFDSDETHYHIKCKSLLNHKKLSELLEIAKIYEIITEAEMHEILSDFDNKYKINIQNMVNSLTENKNEQEIIKDIHNYIKKCSDLNTLIYLHQELLKSQYSFLRKCKGSSSSYIGMTAIDGTISHSSETWAKIEKSLELQMVHILDTICPDLTPEMGSERAAELRLDNPFFGIKHHITHFTQNNIQNSSIYSSLQAGYAHILKEKYARHFDKMVASKEKPETKKMPNTRSSLLNVGFFQTNILPLMSSNAIFKPLRHLKKI